MTKNSCKGKPKFECPTKTRSCRTKLNTYDRVQNSDRLSMWLMTLAIFGFGDQLDFLVINHKPGA